jgi:hypothetical protein
LIPSISIDPEYNSIILLRDRQIVLLPAPVLPTTPIFSPGLTLKERSLSTFSVFGLYFSVTSLNVIEPSSGHSYLSSINCMFPSSVSYGICSNFRHLSMLTILYSSSAKLRIDHITNSCSMSIDVSSITGYTLLESLGYKMQKTLEKASTVIDIISILSENQVETAEFH